MSPETSETSETPTHTFTVRAAEKGDYGSTVLTEWDISPNHVKFSKYDKYKNPESEPSNEDNDTEDTKTTGATGATGDTGDTGTDRLTYFPESGTISTPASVCSVRILEDETFHPFTKNTARESYQVIVQLGQDKALPQYIPGPNDDCSLGWL